MQEALQAFRNGTVQVLVATDVAGRGLHIKNLPYIVNYDFPSRMEPYIHRVGRTGRLASSGHAFSFFTRNMAPLARPLLDHLLVHPPLDAAEVLALATQKPPPAVLQPIPCDPFIAEGGLPIVMSALSLTEAIYDIAGS